MPFMTGNVSKRFCKIVCNFELCLFSSHLRRSKPEPVTGPFLASTVTFHTVNYGTHHIVFLQMFVKLIKYHLLFLRQYNVVH